MNRRVAISVAMVVSIAVCASPARATQTRVSGAFTTSLGPQGIQGSDTSAVRSDVGYGGMLRTGWVLSDDGPLHEIGGAVEYLHITHGDFVGPYHQFRPSFFYAFGVRSTSVDVQVGARAGLLLGSWNDGAQTITTFGGSFAVPFDFDFWMSPHAALFFEIEPYVAGGSASPSGPRDYSPIDLAVALHLGLTFAS